MFSINLSILKEMLINAHEKHFIECVIKIFYFAWRKEDTECDFGYIEKNYFQEL